MQVYHCVCLLIHCITLYSYTLTHLLSVLMYELGNERETMYQTINQQSDVFQLFDI